MKAVILVENEQTLLRPLAKICPAAMLPVVNRPLLEYTIHFLKGIGIREIGMVLNRETSQIAEYFGSAITPGVRISYAFQDRPEGSGAAVWRLSNLLKGEPFLLISGSTFLYGAALSKEVAKALTLHRQSDATATILVTLAERGPILESIRNDGPEVTEQFRTIYPDAGPRKLMHLSGIYAFSPDLLELIPRGEYCDIVEQLLPALYARGLHIRIHPVNGNAKVTIRTAEDYYKLNHGLLSDPSFSTGNGMVEGRYVRLTDGVWIGKNTQIAPTAHLCGPIVLGDNCRIGEGAQIIGPAILGHSSVVGRRAFLRESVIWDKVVLEEESRVTYSIVESFCRAPKGENWMRTLVTRQALSGGDLNLLGSAASFPGDSRWLSPALKPKLKSVAFNALKRGVDLLGAVLGLLLCLPLFAIVAGLIKWNSKGPIFFTQWRCGKGGREFKMIKFRTMIATAGDMQPHFQDKKEVDGPVFKLQNDPRITRVGRSLRKTSIDELPQLLNVIKGEMSLVGPRPLASEEMRFHPAWRDIRLRVKPGITGLWQVNGRSQTRFADWVKYDVDYVANQSLLLDLKILVKTLGVVIRTTGAH